MEQSSVNEFSWQEEFGTGYGLVAFSKKSDDTVERLSRGSTASTLRNS
jgi:hypothetical protein